jgi:hypothetical protein
MDHYASFTGLKVNYHKYSMIPINVPHDKAVLLAQAFQCQLGTLPFTYLGLPMGTTKPSIKELSPLIDRIERRLSATSSFLSYGDRLVLVNSVMSSLPTYFMLSLSLPVGILDVIDRAWRHCLWRKKDKNKVQSLAAWDMICKPKDKGGLGILNLSVQNNALLLKHLHKFYNHDSIPWVQLIWDSYYYDVVPHVVTLSGSFWWKNIMKLSDQYRVLTKCAVGNGSSVLFWSDLWKHQVLASQFDRLFSFAKDKLQSLKDFMGAETLLHNFHLPLSIEAHEELFLLQGLLHGFQLQSDNNDSWVFNSGKRIFKPSIVYKHHFSHLATHHPSCAIWKSKCILKHKFFAWLILHDRINTKDMILRRH